MNNATVVSLFLTNVIPGYPCSLSYLQVINKLVDIDDEMFSALIKKSSCDELFETYKMLFGSLHCCLQKKDYYNVLSELKVPIELQFCDTVDQYNILIGNNA